MSFCEFKAAVPTGNVSSGTFDLVNSLRFLGIGR